MTADIRTPDGYASGVFLCLHAGKGAKQRSGDSEFSDKLSLSQTIRISEFTE